MRENQTLAGFLLSPITDTDKKESSQGNDLPPLNGLRGLAVLIVIASHTSAFGMAGQGGIGVFLFFQLSGFVLAVPFAQRKEISISWRETWRFFVNRVLRIYPAYIAAVLLIAWRIGEGGGWIARQLMMLDGWNHLWTVVMEAKFYAIFPPVIFAISFLKPRWMQYVGLVVLIYAAWLARASIPAYVYVFLVGVLTCFIYEADAVKRILQTSLSQRILGPLSAAVLASIVFTSPEMRIQTHLDRLIADSIIAEPWCLIFGVLMFGVLSAPNSAASKWMTSWHMRHIGLLSYGLYLFHVPVLAVMQPRGMENAGLFFTTVAATWVVAYGSYAMIERPILKNKEQIAIWLSSRLKRSEASERLESPERL